MPRATHHHARSFSPLGPRRWRRMASWVALGVALGCASAPMPAVMQTQSITVEPAHAEGARSSADACPVSKQPELAEPPELIAPEERVPDFLLASESCEIFDSRELVGKQPFVVVFFASWCSVCEHKMPLLREALDDRSDQLTSVFVSLDDATGWSETEAFLARHGLVPTSAVAGRDFLGFSLGYNPFRSVPVVVIVGRSGRVVDVQIGVREGDAPRLLRALDRAIDEAPERPRLTSYRPR